MPQGHTQPPCLERRRLQQLLGHRWGRQLRGQAQGRREGRLALPSLRKAIEHDFKVTSGKVVQGGASFSAKAEKLSEKIQEQLVEEELKEFFEEFTED